MTLNRNAIAAHLFADETSLVQKLAQAARLETRDQNEVQSLAKKLAQNVRDNRKEQGSIDAFMQQYSLSSDEGIVLMCLAEALLRIPDAETQDRLIADKIGNGDWQKHLGQSDSLFVNASAWGLMLTGKVLSLGDNVKDGARNVLARLTNRMGEPVIRTAMRQAMRVMGKQFVLGRTIVEALDLAKSEKEWRYSFDMLGESALTASDAARYYKSYENALQKIGQSAEGASVFERPSLSIKLSALHPRYDEKNRKRSLDQLFQDVGKLAREAKHFNVGLTIDAEEAARLDLSLELFQRLASDETLRGWNGLGLAVQAYSKRALPVLEWLADLARETTRILPVRLVKGAYWDTEIKRAQEGGFEGFPVYTRKSHTDVSYLAAAKFMLARRDFFYPQFATHNAQTVAAISVMAGDDRSFEYQRLHGMGASLYRGVITNQPCRIYAPVGSHEDLLAYLVRRLLENGANASFVNRLADDDLPLEDVVRDPIAQAEANGFQPSQKIKLPASLFPQRRNSRGVPLWDHAHRAPIEDAIRVEPQPLSVQNFVADDAKAAMKIAAAAFPRWSQTTTDERAHKLEAAADLFESHQNQLLSLLVREAGKTLENALADLREAVDFLRYYAEEARRLMGQAKVLPGPTGEKNELSLHGRGVFVCISPWNFPLAIFTGQIAAALATGNTVVAKPAEQTPLIALLATKLMHQAGIPKDALQCLPGDGATLGKVLLSHPALRGVAFTGSNETATNINRTIAARDGAFPVLIAETGGINAMIADSSALPEQVVRDVVASAFDSAGQRCSAARVLFVQEDVADKIITMLKGAMDELVIGDPLEYQTDVGPVIDREAQSNLDAHKVAMSKHKVIRELQLPNTLLGVYVAPAAYEIAELSVLKREVFGPVLHVIRFDGEKLGDVISQINASGFGLTLGLHTRIDSTIELVRKHANVGNLYINRNQIGAVVGAQPFGGEGLSGTGPKAGGPHYLARFCVERVMSHDTTAAGGNAMLIAQGE